MDGQWSIGRLVVLGTLKDKIYRFFPNFLDFDKPLMPEQKIGPAYLYGDTIDKPPAIHYITN